MSGGRRAEVRMVPGPPGGEPAPAAASLPLPGAALHPARLWGEEPPALQGPPQAPVHPGRLAEAAGARRAGRGRLRQDTPDPATGRPLLGKEPGAHWGAASEGREAG